VGRFPPAHGEAKRRRRSQIHRSVSGEQKGAAAYQANADATIRAAIAGQIQTWDDAVGAFYYALLGAHMLSSLCFALATWGRESFWDRAVAVGFVATTT
jgi:hypothetical protein